MKHLIKLLPALLVCAACSTTNGEKKADNGDSSKEAETPSYSGSSSSAGMTAGAKAEPPRSADHGLAGFAVYEDDGRLWIFKDGSKDHAMFLDKGEPAKRVTLVGEGPGGKTIMGADKGVLKSYALGQKYACPGYAVYGTEAGRLWIFKNGTPSHEEFMRVGEPAKRVTLVGAGPDGKTIMGADRGTLDAYTAGYRYGRPGYAVFMDDGRLWVFRKGSTALVEFTSKGEPAKRVTLVGEGPDGRTIMSADRETIDGYLFGRPGFVVIPEDGRLWIFRKGDKGHRMFVEKGEPASRVTLVGAGPMGKTIMSDERSTLDAYLGAAEQ